MPRIRSIILTSASLSLPEALTKRVLRRCAFLKFWRRRLRSSRMSWERARRRVISLASWSEAPAASSSLPARLLESLEAGRSSAPAPRLFPNSRLVFGGASPSAAPRHRCGRRSKVRRAPDRQSAAAESQTLQRSGRDSLPSGAKSPRNRLQSRSCVFQGNCCCYFFCRCKRPEENSSLHLCILKKNASQLFISWSRDRHIRNSSYLQRILDIGAHIGLMLGHAICLKSTLPRDTLHHLSDRGATSYT